MDGDYGAAIQVFREAAALGLLPSAGETGARAMLQLPRVVASGLSGELLLAIRDAIRQARTERGLSGSDASDEA